MCDPMTIASVAVSAMSSVVQFQAQQQQYQLQMEMYRNNAETAAKATVAEYEGINNRVIQEGMAANQKKFEAGLESRAAVSTAATAAGEGNVSGLSVDYVLGDFYAREGRFDASVDTNFDMTRAYLHNEMKGAEARGQSQINSVPLPEKPNPAAMLVNIFGAAINGMASAPRR